MNSNNSKNTETRLAADKIGPLIARYSIPSAVTLILSTGSLAQMSIAMGEQDYVKFKTSLKTRGISVIAYSVLITLGFTIFPSQLAASIEAKGDLFNKSLDYIHGLIRFMATNFCSIFFDSLLKTLGHPRFSMSMAVSSILLNNGLRILFVTVFDMETCGVGLKSWFATPSCNLLSAKLLILI